MLSCDRGLKADENWMSVETSWVRDVVRRQRYSGRPACKVLKVVQQIYNRSATNTKPCSNKSTFTTSSQPLPQVQRQVKEQAVLPSLYLFCPFHHYTIASL